MSHTNAGNALLRVITGMALLTFVLGLLLVERLNVGFTIFIALFATVGLHEYHIIAQRDASRWERLGGFTAVLAMMVCAHYGGFHATTICLLLAVLVVAILHLFSGNRTIQGLTSAIFGVVYVGWFAAHFILIKQLGLGNQGGLLVLFLILIIAVSDTAAYFTGKNFGRHKLAPKISPKKTWEGAAGAIFGTAVVSVIWGIWRTGIFTLGSDTSAPDAQSVPVVYIGALVFTAVLLSIIGQIGDLVESMLKRDAGIKDSGNILPGHGGILDRCDGFLFAGPVMYQMLVNFPTLTSF